MLNRGEKAPDFELETDSGDLVSLDTLLADGPLLLYFYPADFTPICTAEACSIRDMHEDIVDSGFTIVGVSPQGKSSHERFKSRHDLPFPLLGDPQKKVIKAFGVDGFLGIGVRRATYAIATDKTITGRVVSDLFVGSHTDFIKKAIADSNAWSRKPGAG